MSLLMLVLLLCKLSQPVSSCLYEHHVIYISILSSERSLTSRTVIRVFPILFTQDREGSIVPFDVERADIARVDEDLRFCNWKGFVPHFSPTSWHRTGFNIASNAPLFHQDTPILQLGYF